jgi:hypothetical protein
MVVALAGRRETGPILTLNPDSYRVGGIGRETVPARVRAISERSSICPLPYGSSGEEHLGRHVDVRV